MTLQADLNKRLIKLKVRQVWLDKWVNDASNKKYIALHKNYVIELRTVKRNIQELYAALWGLANYKLKELFEKKSPLV